MDAFGDRLAAAVKEKGNAVCVGIDPRLEQLPAALRASFPETLVGASAAIGEFAIGVVDAVAHVAPVVKFQSAFYEAYGPDGIAALHLAMRYAAGKGLIVILDGKRNDIGSTAEAYAQAYVGTSKVQAEPGRSEAAWDADALTINPWLGSDGITPFVDAAGAEGKGLFVLVRTSNPSAGEFQDLIADGEPIYRHVARKVAGWNRESIGASGYGLVGAVVGATTPAQLAELRAVLPGVWFLVPGYGAQGGTAEGTAGAFDENGLGAIVNNSRGLTFAFRRPDLKSRYGDDWKAAIAHATHEMADDLARSTPAGRLRG